jgi:hypothetical protein
VTGQYSGVIFSAGLYEGTPTDCGALKNVTSSQGDPTCLSNFPPNGSVATASFAITFTETQTQAGFNFGTNEGTSTFEAYLGVELVLAEIDVPTSLNDQSNFFGFDFVSEGLSFDRIRVLPGGLGSFMLLDNLTFNYTPSGTVPEPGSLALAALALAGLALSRRKSS